MTRFAPLAVGAALLAASCAASCAAAQPGRTFTPPPPPPPVFSPPHTFNPPVNNFAAQQVRAHTESFQQTRNQTESRRVEQLNRAHTDLLRNQEELRRMTSPSGSSGRGAVAPAHFPPPPLIPVVRRGSEVVVTEVTVNSTAEQLGLKKGDVLVSFARYTLRHESQLIPLIRRLPADGTTAPLVVERDGGLFVIDVPAGRFGVMMTSRAPKN